MNDVLAPKLAFLLNFAGNLRKHELLNNNNMNLTLNIFETTVE